jgi:1-acyl-sn-glycerol-3-phosphate acyltransferase
VAGDRGVGRRLRAGAAVAAADRGARARPAPRRGGARVQPPQLPRLRHARLGAGPRLRRPVRFLAKREVWASRWTGWLVRWGEAVPVDRSSASARAGAFDAAAQALRPVTSSPSRPSRPSRRPSTCCRSAPVRSGWRSRAASPSSRSSGGGPSASPPRDTSAAGDPPPRRRPLRRPVPRRPDVDPVVATAELQRRMEACSTRCSAATRTAPPPVRGGSPPGSGAARRPTTRSSPTTSTAPAAGSTGPDRRPQPDDDPRPHRRPLTRPEDPLPMPRARRSPQPGCRVALPRRRLGRLHRHAVQRWRFDVHGLEHVPRLGGAVIASNHTSFWDFFTVGRGPYLGWGRPVRILAKESLFRVPVFGPLMRRAEHIPVHRGAGAPALQRRRRAARASWSSCCPSRPSRRASSCCPSSRGRCAWPRPPGSPSYPRCRGARTGSTPSAGASVVVASAGRGPLRRPVPPGPRRRPRRGDRRAPTPDAGAARRGAARLPRRHHLPVPGGSPPTSVAARRRSTTTSTSRAYATGGGANTASPDAAVAAARPDPRFARYIAASASCSSRSGSAWWVAVAIPMLAPIREVPPLSG